MKFLTVYIHFFIKAVVLISNVSRYKDISRGALETSEFVKCHIIFHSQRGVLSNPYDFTHVRHLCQDMEETQWVLTTKVRVTLESYCKQILF